MAEEPSKTDTSPEGEATGTKPVIGILSIGDMGFGIAKLLLSHGYTVTTCTAGRSQATISRVKSASIKGYETDSEFVGNSDIILSIVPPRDAIATAKRVVKAAYDDLAIEARSSRKTHNESLLYIDLNAISPVTSRRIAQIFTRAPQPVRTRADSKATAASAAANAASPTIGDRSRSNSEALNDGSTSPPPQPQPQQQPQRRLSLRQRLTSFASSSQSPPSNIAISDVSPLVAEQPPIKISYLDGGIIGGPPHLPSANKTATSKTSKTSGGSSGSSGSSDSAGPSGGSSSSSSTQWVLPSLVISGPPTITEPFLPQPLRSILNMTVVSPTIGDASTLKCSFASLTKGFTALGILSFTTVHSQSPSLLPHLIRHLEHFQPNQLKFLQSSVPRMPPKAYRWIDEMREIGLTFSTPVDEQGGGFADAAGKRLFDAVAEVYRVISEDTDLPENKKQQPTSGTGPSPTAVKRPISSVLDVAEGVREGIAAKQRRSGGPKDGKEKEKLELTWRGSWS